jgi:hypothetical protein
MERLLAIPPLCPGRFWHIINPIQNPTSVEQPFPDTVGTKKGIVGTAVLPRPSIGLWRGGKKMKTLTCQTGQQTKQVGAVFAVGDIQNVVPADKK